MDTNQEVAQAVGKPGGAVAPSKLVDRIKRYGLALLLAPICHLIIWCGWHEFGSAMFTVSLAGVVLASLYGGAGPGVVATLLLTIDLDYAFLPPYHSLALNYDGFFYVVAFFIIAIVISSLQGRRRRAEEDLRMAQEDLEQRVLDRTEELSHSREQFSLLVNGFADQAFFVLDRAGNIASWNDGAARLLGYRQQEILARHITDIWPDAERVETPMGTTAAWRIPSTRYEFHDWIVRKDQSRFWGYVFLTPIDRDNPTHPRGYAVAMRDVTERQSLERDILTISEHERLSIGRDLHDGLGQELTGAAMLSTALSERLSDEGVAAADDAEAIADLIHESIAHTRDLARGLCPLDLEDNGLPGALRQLTDRLARLPRLGVQFSAPEQLRIEAPVAAHLYRIAQEAIQNAIRHGRPTTISVDLTTSAERLCLRIRDDGKGITSDTASGGMGLRLMRYRAKMIRGQLSIERGQPGGTTVTCVVALADLTPQNADGSAGGTADPARSPSNEAPYILEPKP